MTRTDDTPIYQTFLRCDLARLPADPNPDPENFQSYNLSPQFQIGDFSLALQWVTPSLAAMYIGGGLNIGLRRYCSAEPDPVTGSLLRSWKDTGQAQKWRVGGRLVHYRHVWNSDSAAPHALPKPDTMQGEHRHGFSWPYDRGGSLLQVAIIHRGPRDAPAPPALLDDILAAFTLSPTVDAHLVTAVPSVRDGILELGGIVVPKISRDWGVIVPRPFDGGRPSYNLRVSAMPDLAPIYAPARGRDMEETSASLLALADRWDVVLTRLPEILADAVMRLDKRIRKDEKQLKQDQLLPAFSSASFEEPLRVTKKDPGELVIYVEMNTSDYESGYSCQVRIRPDGRTQIKC
ncbi:MAG: hypothetical protein DI616_04695 [Paracoccus denitrificans]|uniref:Uncharacterized protein n=1 Tax=Paracoccus denitrificans TaxID=266 RepID=A0A533IC06_PARDE|nr:MAG: hypothetical protein DI616_04695 [Paracoccus denitrificans]